VDQPSLEECVQILKGLRDRYEAHHKVNITDEALEAAAELADRYISDRFLPDKAIDLIDEAASRMRIKSMSSPPVYRELEEEIETVRKEKEAAIEAQEFEKAANLRDKERRLTNKKRELEDARESGESGERPSIAEEEIADIVSMWTGIPVFKLTEAETQKLMRMEDELHKRVIGQHQAIVAVSKAIRRARAASRTRSARPARSSSSARQGWARPSWDARWPSSSSGTRRRWSASTCPSTWRSTRSAAWSARRPDTSATTRAAS
jgi:ATP-dependent Clp protease ATP-binding subunit ClpC